jgi:hypothetical protein
MLIKLAILMLPQISSRRKSIFLLRVRKIRHGFPTGARMMAGSLPEVRALENPQEVPTFYGLQDFADILYIKVDSFQVRGCH